LRCRETSSNAARVLSSARVARYACHVVVMIPTINKDAMAVEAATPVLFRRRNFRRR
jgi:hypothetical protein